MQSERLEVLKARIKQQIDSEYEELKKYHDTLYEEMMEKLEKQAIESGKRMAQKVLKELANKQKLSCHETVVESVNKFNQTGKFE